MLKLDFNLQTPLALQITCQSKAAITALLGHSGSGKTTLLRAIAGLDSGLSSPSNRGKVEINADDIHRQPTHLRPIAMVQQKPHLFGHWSIAEHIQQVRKRALGQTLEVEPLCIALGVEPLLKLYPRQLSGGQSQRVALLLALLREPKLLLLDEALSALDENSKRRLFAPLKNALQQINAQAILVSHQLRDCAALADHCWVLQRSEAEDTTQISYSGEIGAGLRHYNGDNSCAALLQARIKDYDEQSNLSQLQLATSEPVETGETTETANNNLAATFYARGNYHNNSHSVRVALYADDIGISLEPLKQSSFANCLAVSISAIEPDNYGHLITGQTAGQSIYIHITTASQQKLQLKVGLQVYAIFKAGAVDILASE